MRYILFFLLLATLLNAQYLRTIRIGTYPDEAAAKKALEKLQKYVQNNKEIVKLQQKWDFRFKERQSGKYYITLAEPFRSRPVLQKVLDNLRLAYPDIYVTRLKSAPAFSPQAKKELPAIKEIPKRVEVQKQPKKALLSNEQSEVKIVEETKEIKEPEVSKADSTVTEAAVVKEEPVAKEEPIVNEKPSVDDVTEESDDLSKDLFANDEQNDQSQSNILETLVIAVALLLMVVALYLFYIYRRTKKNLENENMKKMMLQEKLEQVNEKLRNKDKIFSHTSHELRNPMTAIIGLSHLLLEEHMSRKQTEYVQKIEGSAKYLLEIINDILDISKMEAGALKIEKREFNLNYVIKHVVNIISVSARENGTRIELDIDHSVPPFIVGDSLRLTQILINLLSNAVKFTKNGVVTLGIKKIAQSADTLTLEFIVKDNGIGMTQKQLKNIFNSYVQGNSSIAREFGGSGLGLSIVKYLVDLMHGDIHVESKKHDGTTFVVQIRFLTYKAKEKRFYRLSSEEYLHKKVLIVEKSQHNIDKLKKAFSYFNYTIHSIPSFKESILDEEIKYDLIVINKELVDAKLINIIQEIKTKDKTKFILFSDSVLDLDKDLLEQLDIDEHLSRPFTQQDLLDLLENVCTTGSRKDAKSRKSVPKKEKLKSLGKKRILIAEDNKLNYKVLSGILADTEIELSFVSNGEDALKTLQRKHEKYDLIILDINMPKLNGYETAMEIRKMDLYEETPILALSADVMKDTIDKCYEVGMQGHIPKPIIVDDFYEKLYKTLLHSEVAHSLVVKKDQPKLPNFTELTVEDGLKHVEQDVRFYKSLLHDFQVLYVDSADRLEELLERNQLKAAREKAMDIKDAAFNIGAFHLCEEAATMQYAFEKGNRGNYNEVLYRYREALKALLKEIRRYLES
jgi:signal transduction histidine kinase/CheY-like chemotaxis protein